MNLEPKPEQCEWEGCGKVLSRGVAKYSWDEFGKPLCIEHQKLERLNRYPEKMAKMVNKSVEKQFEKKEVN